LAPETSPAPPAEHEAPQGIVATARELWAEERVEVVAAILLSLATVMSAWGAYQATRWNGEQADRYAESASLRADSGRHGTVASRQVEIDTQTYIAWVDAKGQGDDDLADFYVERFRPEFLPAFVAWRLGADEGSENLPEGTPFDVPEYANAEQTIADGLFAQADEALAGAQLANQISDNFVLTAVLFASVLLFAGIAPRFKPEWIRWSMLGIGAVVFAIGLIVVFSLPQSVSF
jgi:hypothetical protein